MNEIKECESKISEEEEEEEESQVLYHHQRIEFEEKIDERESRR